MDNHQSDSTNLKELLILLQRHIWIILISFFTCIATIVFFTFTADDQYEASATLSILEGSDFHGQLLDLPSIARQKYVLKTQISILESNTLTAEVVENIQKSMFRDTLRLLGFKPPSKRDRFLNKICPICIRLDTTRLIQGFQKRMEVFYASTRVSYGRDSDIIKLKGRAKSPWEAAFLVNMWLDTYQQLLQSDTRGEVSQTRLFLQNKLKEIEKKLAKSEDELRIYQKRKKVVALSNETEQLVEQLANFESIYNQTRTDLEATENQLEYLKNKLDENRKRMIDNIVGLSNPVIQELKKQMAGLVAKKAAYEAQLLGAGFSVEEDIKLRQMENRLKGVQDRIVKETKKLAESDITSIDPVGQSEKLVTEILNLQTIHQSLLARINTLEQIVYEYSSKLQKLPDKNLELARLERDVQLNTKIYIMLREKFEEIRIQEAGQSGIIRVLDRAMKPLYPIKPRKKIILFFGVIFGLLLGIGLAFILDYFADTIRDVHDVEDLGIKVIGTVPSRKKEKLKKTWQKRDKDSNLSRARSILPQLMFYKNDHDEVMEAFRALRTTVYFSKRQKNMKTFLFTSPHPGEGKSTTVANMAIAMAKKGVNTLIVDTDLRKPVQDALFLGSQKKSGLTNHLSKTGDWKHAIRDTSINNLSILSSGPLVKNAPELLSSKRVSQLIKSVAEFYGIVLFDSPPILPVTDATIIATLVDCVILIVRVGKTTKESIQKAISKLEDVNVQILGAILTDMKNNSSYGYRKYRRQPL